MALTSLWSHLILLKYSVMEVSVPFYSKESLKPGDVKSLAQGHTPPGWQDCAFFMPPPVSAFPPHVSPLMTPSVLFPGEEADV